jgi:AbrB family looped-hinge helix DNA binding protein
MSRTYARVTSKGQLTIPADLRKQMKLSHRTQVAIQREANTLVLRPITPEFIDGLVGCTKGAGAEWKRVHRRDR